MRNKILVVDDDELSRELLKQMFEEDHEILMARDGKEAILKIEKYREEIAAVLLDLVMPVMNGYQVLQVLNDRKILDQIPVILITANADLKTETSCYALGATAIINKPYVAEVVRKQVSNVIEIYTRKWELESRLSRQAEEILNQQKRLEQFYDRLLDAISNIVEFRDMESGTHIRRVKGLTEIMARAYIRLYPDSPLTEEKIRVIVRASALHDIGKISVPDHILLKPGRLTMEEREIMKSHTTKGCEILSRIMDVQEHEQYVVSYEICRYHHERYDGKGYPDGLKGDEIPLSAQLVSIADVYDALVSERIYKTAYDKEMAYAMIMRGECGVFSPRIMKCFEFSKDALEAFSDENKDASPSRWEG